MPESSYHSGQRLCRRRAFKIKESAESRMLPSEAKPPGRRGRRIDNINVLRRRAGDHVLPQFAGYM
jgi:hypothetical protein